MDNRYNLNSDSLFSNLLGFDFTRAGSFFGAHQVEAYEMQGWMFRVWAPNARSVCVMGSFNGWNPHQFQMKHIGYGVWELFLPSLRERTAYEFSIHTRDGRTLNQADPFAFYTTRPPECASRLYRTEAFQWHDEGWMNYRRMGEQSRPVHIYRLHLGSWRRTGAGQMLTCDGIGEWLIPYLKRMGYTHVELMDGMESFDPSSLGYSPTSYFAPNSLLGEPVDFMELVDLCHQSGIGVILDWTPAFFPQNISGLSHFDGTQCYELPVTLNGVEQFDFGRTNVRSFLISSALFWLETYHFDGLCVTKITDLIGQPSESAAAISFLNEWNHIIHRECPDVMTIASGEDLRYPLTGPDSLGFDLTWDYPWQQRLTRYQQLDPIFRQFSHSDLTGDLTRQLPLQQLLPLNRETTPVFSLYPMEEGEKFASSRTYYLYFLTWPGSKLTFMGFELGQTRQWNPDQSLDWHLLQYDPFKNHQAFVQAANEFYLTQPALWDDTNLKWLCADDAQGNCISYLRQGQDGQPLLFAANFSRVFRKGYRLGVPEPGCYQVLFSTVGPGGEQATSYSSDTTGCHGQSHSICVDLPPLSAVVLRLQKRT